MAIINIVILFMLLLGAVGILAGDLLSPPSIGIIMTGLMFVMFTVGSGMAAMNGFTAIGGLNALSGGGGAFGLIVLATMFTLNL